MPENYDVQIRTLGLIRRSQVDIFRKGNTMSTKPDQAQEDLNFLNPVSCPDNGVHLSPIQLV